MNLYLIYLLFTLNTIRVSRALRRRQRRRRSDSQDNNAPESEIQAPEDQGGSPISAPDGLQQPSHMANHQEHNPNNHDKNSPPTVEHHEPNENHGATLEEKEAEVENIAESTIDKFKNMIKSKIEEILSGEGIDPKGAFNLSEDEKEIDEENEELDVNAGYIIKGLKESIVKKVKERLMELRERLKAKFQENMDKALKLKEFMEDENRSFCDLIISGEFSITIEITYSVEISLDVESEENFC